VPIRLDDYVELHLKSNPDVDRADLVDRLQFAITAKKQNIRCNCGEPIWIIGAAEAGLACFACITGSPVPDDDYEIDISESA